jgi:hypothetical protein
MRQDEGIDNNRSSLGMKRSGDLIDSRSDNEQAHANDAKTTGEDDLSLMPRFVD